MSTALDLHALPGWLRKEIGGAPAGATAVLGGHYAIFSSGATPTDLLESPEPPAQAPTELLEFTRHTWREACGAAAATRTARARLLVLVDDLQFVHPDLTDRGTREQLAVALAARYLESVPMLPAFHTRVLAEHGLGGDDILRHGESRWLFSERELRQAAVERVRRVLPDGGSGGATLVTTDGGQTITVRVPGHGEVTLIHSGHTNCAGGWLELLAQVCHRGVRKLIALVPMRCLAPVTLGTTLAHRLGLVPGLHVVTVAFADVQSRAPAAVVRGAA